MLPDPLFSLSGQHVAITGVSGKLGATYADAVLSRGGKVTGLDLHPTAASEDLARRFPADFQFIPADVTSRTSLQDALVRAIDHGGVPTALINNAAIDSPPSAPAEENGPFEDYPEASWDRVISVNLKGPFLACQVFGTEMVRAGRGSIVNVGSIYGVVSPDQSLYEYRRSRGETFFKPVAYSASKSGIYNLTRYLAVYWAKAGVRVNSLTIAGVFSGQEAAFLDAYCSRIPVGRMADGEDYVGPILFMITDASRYMTGSNLSVDGGWTAI
jgi:NAD(P)-dependent dehydrogenase (short-subunit alcohol dehydrogenase family)